MIGAARLNLMRNHAAPAAEILHVQDWTEASDTDGDVTTGSKTVTAGDFIFVMIGANTNSNTATVTDTLGNTYSLLKVDASTRSSFGRAFIYGTKSATGGSNAISVSIGTCFGLSVQVAEFSGLDDSLTLDSTVGHGAAAFNTIHTASWSTSYADCLLLVVGTSSQGGNDALTTPVPSGFSVIADNDYGTNYCTQSMYKIVTATQSGIVAGWTSGISEGDKEPCAGVAVKRAA